MRKRTDSKRQEILDIARAAFVAQGYAGASMATIAAEVGGSKSTLYGYFPSKERLFSAVVHSVGDAHAVPALDLLDQPESPAVVLQAFGAALISFLMLPAALASYRLVIAEAGRFPALGKAYFDNGPMRGERRLAAWMAARQAAGELAEGDPARLAQEFIGLCKAGPYQAALCGHDTLSSPAEIAEQAKLATASFLAAHVRAPRPRAPQ